MLTKDQAHELLALIAALRVADKEVEYMLNTYSAMPGNDFRNARAAQDMAYTDLLHKVTQWTEE